MKKEYAEYDVIKKLDPDYKNRKCFYHSFNYLVNVFLGILNPGEGGNFDEGFNTIISTIIIEYGDCGDDDDTCVNRIWESINKENGKYLTGKVKYIKENFNISTLRNELNELKKNQNKLSIDLKAKEAALKAAEAALKAAEAALKAAEHETSLSLGLRLIDNTQVNEVQKKGGLVVPMHAIKEEGEEGEEDAQKANKAALKVAAEAKAAALKAAEAKAAALKAAEEAKAAEAKAAA